MIKQKLTFIASCIFICTMAISSSSCQNSSNTIQTLKIEEYQKKLEEKSNIQLVDVRTGDEYKEGHLKGASNVDWNGNAFDAGIKSLDKSKPTFVYCLAGGRSASAAARLEKLGFKEIYNMDGGIMAWKKANKPLEKNESSATAVNTAGMSVVDYEKMVSAEKLVLVDFNAPWCGPCKKMKPILEEISSEQKSKIKIIPINADDNEILTGKLKIEALPTFILYKNGKQVERFLGFTNKEKLMDILSKYL